MPPRMLPRPPPQSSRHHAALLLLARSSGSVDARRGCQRRRQLLSSSMMCPFAPTRPTRPIRCTRPTRRSRRPYARRHCSHASGASRRSARQACPTSTRRPWHQRPPRLGNHRCSPRASRCRCCQQPRLALAACRLDASTAPRGTRSTEMSPMAPDLRRRSCGRARSGTTTAAFGASLRASRPRRGSASSGGQSTTDSRTPTRRWVRLTGSNCGYARGASSVTPMPQQMAQRLQRACSPLASAAAGAGRPG